MVSEYLFLEKLDYNTKKSTFKQSGCKLHDGVQKTSSLILSFYKTRTVQVKGTDCQQVKAQSLLNTAKTN